MYSMYLIMVEKNCWGVTTGTLHYIMHQADGNIVDQNLRVLIQFRFCTILKHIPLTEEEE